MNLSERIERNRARIVASWRQRAEAELPARFGPVGPEIPGAIERVIDRLQGAPSVARADRSTVSASVDEISVDALVLEVNLLRRVVLAVLEEGGPLSAEDRDALLTTLDAHVASVIAASSAHVDERTRTQEWLDLAVQAGGIGAWRWDLGHEAVLIVRNEQYDQIMDIEPGAPWTAEMLFAIVHPEDVDDVRQKLAALASGRADLYDATYRIRRRDGSFRWIHAQGRSVRDACGRIIRLTGALRDITDGVTLQADRDRFVATLSHDLRNPLAAARANAELLRKYWARVESRERLLDKIIFSIDRADGLIQDLLDASRLQSGEKLDLPPTPDDLEHVLFECVEDMSALYGDRFRLSVEGSFQGTWCCSAFRRVVENLTSNAVKYGAADMPVTLSLRRAGDKVVLSVHNHGEPIPPREQARLFEPFHRAMDSRTCGARGWGLGLTVVRAIAAALDARLELESDAEHGTTFTIFFPSEMTTCPA